MVIDHIHVFKFWHGSVKRWYPPVSHFSALPGCKSYKGWEWLSIPSRVRWQHQLSLTCLPPAALWSLCGVRTVVTPEGKCWWEWRRGMRRWEEQWSTRITHSLWRWNSNQPETRNSCFSFNWNCARIQLQTLSFLCLFRTEMMQVILRGDSTILEDMRTKDAEMKEFLSNVPAFRWGRPRGCVTKPQSRNSPASGLSWTGRGDFLMQQLYQNAWWCISQKARKTWLW